MRISFILFAVGVAAFSGTGCTNSGPPDRIVFVVVDTLRRDAIGCHGGDAVAPTIDRLGHEGQCLTNAIASYHQTTMSMGALFTGLTPSLESDDIARSIPFEGRTFCGLARFDPDNTRVQCIPPAVATLGETMRDAGYWSIGITSNPLLFDPYGLSRGFDDWSEVGDPATTRASCDGQEFADSTPIAVCTRSARWVNPSVAEALERRKSDHFFLYVHYMEVHDYHFQKKIESGPFELQDKYRQAVESMDGALGELLEMLGERELLEDTLVVLTSDHGERFHERHFVNGKKTHYGNPSFEEVLEVPLVVWPARFERSDALVRGTDVFGMLATFAGADPPSPSRLSPGDVFTSERKWLTYRTGKWKSYTRRSQRGLFLVNLESDPDERHNVAKQNPEVSQLHWDRVSALAKELSTSNQSGGSLTESDKARLRMLGYHELVDSVSTDFEAADSTRDGLTWKQRMNPGFREWRPPVAQ